MDYRAPGGPIRRFVDFNDPRSAASSFRRRRAAAFSRAVLAPSGRTRVVDLGGTPEFWLATLTADVLGRLDVTCINLEPHDPPPELPPGFRVEVRYGDACDLRDVPDAAFDVAFSNSVIEHVGGVDRQRAFAREARRVGRRYWVQTPNRFFPVEPHYLFPAFQFLPRPLKRFVARRWRFGWMEPGSPAAMAGIDEIRLLSAGEMRALFPDAELRSERALGLTKSLIAVRR